MKRSRRPLWIGGIILGILLLLTILIAPSAKNLTGSTFGRGPDGYGAWYEFMHKEGKSIQQWKRPFTELIQKAKTDRKTGQFATLLQIYAGITEETLDPTLFGLSDLQKEWVKQGNTLVVLGSYGSVTPANFRTQQNSSKGPLKIETTLRVSQDETSDFLSNKNSEETKFKTLLGDRFGAVVWQKNIEKGTVIYTTTPYLGANAYQDIPGNFPFLAQIVTQQGNHWYVDEYLHGFKDKDVITREAAKNWIGYITKTPLLPILLQGSILLILLIWAENRRFGIPQTIQAPITDNSKAYIQALSGVLQKAERSEFVLEVVGQEEQLQLQQKLGLGSTLLEPDALIAAWIEQTGHPAVELQQILSTKDRKRRLSDPELKIWLEMLQTLRQRTPT
jgi:hypothetical protein